MVVTRIGTKQFQTKFNMRVNGERIYRKRVFTTRLEAETWETNERYSILHPEETKSQTSFSDYAENYIELYKSKGSDRTYHLYLWTLKNIKLRFGSQELTSVTRDNLQLWFNDFGKNHAVTTAEKLYRQVHVIIRAATEDGIIERDIAKGVSFSGSDPEPADEKYLEFDDYLVLMDYLHRSANFERMSEMMMLFALTTGVRYGEIAGMTWDNINFKKAVVTIDKQWIPSNHKFSLTKNRGHSDRIVSIPPQVLAQFQNMKKVQQLYLKNTGHDISRSWQWKGRKYYEKDFMFISPNYEVPKNDSCNDRLEFICNELDIKRISMHGLRHTHATRLIYAQYSDWYIAKRLGHASLKELHRTYGHVFEQMQAEADTKLRDSIGADYEGKTAQKIVDITKTH